MAQDEQPRERSGITDQMKVEGWSDQPRPPYHRHSRPFWRRTYGFGAVFTATVLALILGAAAGALLAPQIIEIWDFVRNTVLEMNTRENVDANAWWLWPLVWR